MVGMETISYDGLKGRPNGDNLDMSEKDKKSWNPLVKEGSKAVEQ